VSVLRSDRPGGLSPAGRRTPALPRGHERFPCFDGLRAVAALTVIGVHTAFESGFTVKRPEFGVYTSRLEIGVAVFFVISGFLLYRPFAAAHFDGRPEPDRRRFWVRRLKRIVPAYWVAFIVATYVLRADTTGHGWYAPLIYLGFAQIYFPHYVLHGLSQAWSLCTEMSFYLALPFYAAWMARTSAGAGPGRRLRRELWGLAGLVALSVAWRIPVLAAQRVPAAGHLPPSGPPQLVDTMTNWLPAYIDQFALGMLLAVLSAYFHATGRTPDWLGRRWAPWASWAAAAAAFVAVSHLGLSLIPLVNSPVLPSLGRQTLYGVFGLFLVAPAVFGPQRQGAIRSLLRWPPLVGAGVISYGLYLWHEAWMHMFLVWTGDRLFDIPWPDMLLPVTALSVAAATLSYRLVERPVIRSGASPRAAATGPGPQSGPGPEPAPLPQPDPGRVPA
jgi:peptidoglycan/LPS O-acetylase OafA/YrhL